MSAVAIPLDWDSGNLTKCQKHGVSVREIEEFFAGEVSFSPDAEHSINEKRYVALEGRALLVIFTFRDLPEGRAVRPISARFMHAKEARRYAEKGT